jgi:hypothetical protein
VCPTEHAEILDCLATPARPRFFVVDLSELSRRAALPVTAHERASQPVSSRYLSLYAVGDVRANCSMKSADLRAFLAHFWIRSLAATSRLCPGKALLLDSLDEHVQRAFDHDRQVAAGVRMTEQVDCVLEFLF